MNPEVRELYLSALDNKTYRLGKGELCGRTVAGNNHVYERHCGLGILHELAVDAGVIDKVLDPTGDFYIYDGHAGWSSQKVLDWAGLSKTEAARIMRLVDQKDYSQAKLAAWVRGNL